MPTIALSEIADSEYRYGSMFFDASKLQHVNHGRFFRAGVNYSHCFWEGWFKPFSGSWGPGYMISDNQGGDHNILWGLNAASTGFMEVTGNFNDGTTLTSFTQTEPIPQEHWTHLAVGWDGAHIMCWTNGVLTHVQAYAPTQRKQGGGNDNTLYVGGSDHNNYWGNVAWVRAYEGYGRCAETQDFIPEMFCRPMGYPAAALANVPQFCVSYQTPSRLFLDAGHFEGYPHHGVPEAVQSTGYSPGAYIGTGLALPTFESGLIDTGSYIPTAPTTPSGAIIWDSFSRENRTPNNPTNRTTSAYTLGTVEVGGVDWTNLDGTASATGAGILNGRAFIFNQAAGKVVETSTQNVDVRVNRLPTTFHYTGLLVRYKDANDYYYIQGGDTAISVTKREGGVTTTTGYTPSSGWTTLRVVANGTTLTVYTGTATEGTFTSQGSFTCTNVTGATRAGIDRPNGVKTPVFYDNFLVKAA